MLNLTSDNFQTPKNPANIAAIPPNINPNRGSNTWLIQPINGPPIAVDPTNATDQKAITLPIIFESVSNCKISLPIARKYIEQNPTTTMPKLNKSKSGANDVIIIALPRKCRFDKFSNCCFLLLCSNYSSQNCTYSHRSY